MKEILVYYLIAFSFKIYCEQRQILYARVKKDDINSSLSVIYEGVNSVLHCSFDANSKHCFGVHGFESEGYSYQPVPPISSEVFWYRSGNKYLNTCNVI